MDRIENPDPKSFDVHYNYLLQVVQEWVNAANASGVVGEDTKAWIEAHKGLLWLYENARTSVDDQEKPDVRFALHNFYGVGHAIQQVVTQFSWREDYPFQRVSTGRPKRIRAPKLYAEEMSAEDEAVEINEAEEDLWRKLGKDKP